MHSLITILQLVLVWLFTYILGYPIIRTLLPRDLDEEMGLLVTPVAGFMVLCFVSFTLSGGLQISASSAVWTVMAVMAAAGLAMQLIPRWRVRPALVLPQLRRALLMAVPMLALALFPFIFFGADTYLGGVNPDYSAGIVDNFYLLEGGYSTTHFGAVGSNTYHPIDNVAGFLTPAARFGADFFGIAIQHLLGVDTRTSLTLAIAFFILNVPLTVYFMCRAVMQFNERASLWSSWLMGVSGPVGMSTLYFYIGQNSGLPALPFLFASVYLMLTRPGWRTLLLCALLSNAMFVNYFAMLPYALAPGGILGLYLLVTGRLPWKRALLLAVGFVVVAVVLKIGTLKYTAVAMEAWGALLNATLQGQFFMEFLTEGFFPYFLGVYNYPTNALYADWLSLEYMRFYGVMIGFALMIVYFWGVARWCRETRDGAARVFVVGALVIYAAVWARYTFFLQYGYAVFKMSSWLQFVLVPFFAFLMEWLVRTKPWRAQAHAWRARAATGIVAVGCVMYILLNVVTSAMYVRDGFGRNTETGYIVNLFGTAGNRDYFELDAALRKYVKPEQSVGMLFTDWMGNFWAGYYMRAIKQSWLAHDLLPGDDENLPDVETGVMVDYYGNLKQEGNQYNHGATDDFYLTYGEKNPNKEIGDAGFDGPPLWQNDTFRLYAKSAARDIMFLAQGFYRVEYREPHGYYRPNPMRWSADGGQFFMLNPSRPGEPYRLGLDVLVGYEYPTDSRTLEVWIDGKKHQVMTVNGSARLQTAPFIPAGDVTKIVILVKERNRRTARRLGLWNRDLPADYRRLNVAFGNFRVILPDTPPPKPPARGRELPFLEWQRFAASWDGLEAGGWMDRTATLEFSVPEGATRGVMRILAPGDVPGHKSLSYPLELKYTVNGREMRKTIPYGSEAELEFAIPPGARMASIRVDSPQSIDPSEAVTGVREKTVKRSILLRSLLIQ